MYMIIVGAGSVGSRLIDIAAKGRNNVVVIEKNEDRAREVSENSDITVLNSEATLVETLREAGAERADALIVTTSDDAVNLMVVAVAHELEIPSIVSVVNDPGHAEFFRKLGAHVLESPEEVVASHLYNMVKRPQVQDFAVLCNGHEVFFRLEVKEGSALVGRSAAESEKKGILPNSFRIVAIERDGKRGILKPETVIGAGDVLTVFSLERVSDEILEKLAG
jgi:trk system potassium uptake protein TrkA